MESGREDDDGAREVAGVNAEVLARLRAWPAAAPLSEAQLRAELEGFLQLVKVINQQAAARFASLPRPPEAESEHRVPYSLYYALYDALFSFWEGDLNALIEAVEANLAETSESLLSDWLSAERSLDDLETARQVARWLGEVDQS